MSRFEYLEARTLRQAVTMAQRYGAEARIVAGSTDFLVRWRLGTWNPRWVINIEHIPGLRHITYNPRSGLRLGALVTIRALETHPAIRLRYSALSAAASSFAGVQVRNLATVGGNVCNASPAGDTLPALLAFDASCRVVGPEGERWVPLDHFFTGPGRTVLQAGEVLAGLQLPPTGPGTGSLYIKHSPRGAMDIATLGVAAVVRLQNGGSVCAEVRIALGAVAPTPIRAYAAEDLLRGQPLTQKLVEAAARQAQGAARPIDDLRGSAEYRRAMVEVLTKRTLERAIEAARSGPMPFELQRSLAVQAAF